MVQKSICPNCKKDNTIRWGYRKTDNRGKVQRYKCKDCKNTFVENNGFFRMRNSPEKITLSLDLFHRGLSTREVQSHLQAFYPHNASNVSVYNWVVKYARKIAQFTDKLKVNSGSYIEVDEMEYHRRKSHKAKLGIDENWFIDAIDVKNRFMLSSTYSKYRSANSVKAVLEKIKKKSDNIKIITTDGFYGYRKPIKKVWGYDLHTRKHLVEHRIVTQLKNEGFNIWVERLHNSIRQRTQNFRGFHGSVNSANAIMKGYEIFYNFVRKHEALKGKTPSDMATNVKFETPNRWLELIQFSK